MSRPPTESDILVGLLLIDDALPREIAEAVGRHPRSVSRSVSELVDEGLVVEKGRSVFALTPEGYAEARGIIRERTEDG
jgi:predicted transcriptional regulator